MQASEFNELLEAELNRVQSMLGSKAEEYASDRDRLHNFKQAAHLEGRTEEQALAGMMVKHTVSIYDMIETGEHYPLDKWAEKITDHVNYLLLLKAIVTEKQQAWVKMEDYSAEDVKAGSLTFDAKDFVILPEPPPAAPGIVRRQAERARF